jgi:hypothetical protein
VASGILDSAGLPSAFHRHLKKSGAPFPYETVEPLCPPASVPDDSTKLVFRDARGAPCAVAHISPAIRPEKAALAATASSEAKKALGPELGSVILVPMFQGRIGNRTFTISPYARPLRTGPILGRIDNYLYRNPILRWLRRATERTLRPCSDGVLEESFALPLRHMASLGGGNGSFRLGAEEALRRLTSGEWRPVQTLMHGDFWRGNFLKSRADPAATPRPEPFVIIDWEGSLVRGYPLNDLFRLASSMRLSSRRLRQEVLRHLEILKCHPHDARGYLLASIGFLGLNLHHFPVDRFLALAVRLDAQVTALLPGS